MRPGARMQAAAEVLADILERHRPASSALADWGKAHRFAGSGDRAAIGTLVYDVLRRRLSLAAQMGSDSPRALVIAAAPGAFALSHSDVAAAADGSAVDRVEQLALDAELAPGESESIFTPADGAYPGGTCFSHERVETEPGRFLGWLSARTC